MKTLFREKTINEYLIEKSSIVDLFISTLNQKELDEFDKEKFISKYKVEIASIDSENIERDESIAINKGSNVIGYGGKNQKNAIRTTFYVPYNGNDDLFDLQPKSLPMNTFYPKGSKSQSRKELECPIVILTSEDTSPENIERSFHQNLQLIKQHLDRLNKIVNVFNSETLPRLIKSSIEKRINEIEKKEKYESKFKTRLRK